jgi:hypothetical protein
MFAFWRDVARTFAVEAVYDLVKHVDALAKEKWASPHRQEEKVRSAQTRPIQFRESRSKRPSPKRRNL